jgi:hypothetical protein
MKPEDAENKRRGSTTSEMEDGRFLGEANKRNEGKRNDGRLAA